jgi:sulfur-oxidizing protein SoxZ
MAMGNPMKIRATLQGKAVEVKVLMQHAMETGLRRNEQGEVIPAHFIQTVSVMHNGKTVLSAEWGPAVSQHPFLAFKFIGGVKGEKVQVTWVDNTGEARTDEAIIH